MLLRPYIIVLCDVDKVLIFQSSSKATYIDDKHDDFCFTIVFRGLSPSMYHTSVHIRVCNHT